MIRRFGILNTLVPEDDHPWYGMPFPGVYVTDADGVITAQFTSTGADLLLDFDGFDIDSGAEVTARLETSTGTPSFVTTTAPSQRPIKTSSRAQRTSRPDLKITSHVTTGHRPRSKPYPIPGSPPKSEARPRLARTNVTYVDLTDDETDPQRHREDPTELARKGIERAFKGFIRHVNEHPDLGLQLNVAYSP